MGDQDEKQTPAAGEGAAGTPPAPGGTPPAPAPAAGTPPPAAGTPPVASKKGGAPDFIHIPVKEFKRRIRRDSEQLLKEELGISLEEAKKILGKAGAAPAPGAPDPAAAAPAPGAPAASPEAERLRLENKELQDKLSAKDKETKKLLRREEEKRMNLRLKSNALLEGVKEDETDYVLSLYARHIRLLKEGEAVTPSRKFFGDLRTKHAHLFNGGSPPVTLLPTTAPPESRQPGGATPNPNTPGTPPKQKTVEEMTDQEFKAHSSATYGYTPGAA